MVTKGKPSARSQSYKANLKLQEKIISTPTSGNDVLPSPISKPVIKDEGARRTFNTVLILQESLLRSVNPHTHEYDSLKLLGQYNSECALLYQDAYDRNIILTKQLDDTNAKLLAQFEVQNADIISLQDELKKTKIKLDFYQQQAEKAHLVPAKLRKRFVPPAADIALSHEQLYQLVLLARDDIHIRDQALEQLQFQKKQLECSFQQILNSSSELLALHVTLLEQHLQLQARLKVSASAVSHYRTKLLEYRATAVQLAPHQAQHQEIQAKYDQIAAQVSKEDTLLKELYDHFDGNYPTYRLDDVGAELRELRPYLWQEPPDDT